MPTGKLPFARKLPMQIVFLQNQNNNCFFDIHHNIHLVKKNKMDKNDIINDKNAIFSQCDK